MSITLEEAAERIIVCGVKEIPKLLDTENIGGIVSTCRSSEYEDEEVNPISLAKQRGIPHYKCLPFESCYGLSEEELDSLSEEEWNSFLCSQIVETFEQIDTFLQADQNTKIIIHCWQGIDRSAVTALAYFLKVQNKDANVYEALKALHKIRPHAQCDTALNPFLALWGEKYDEYAGAIHDFRGLNFVYHTFKGKPDEFRLFVEFRRESHPEVSLAGYIERFQRFGIDFKL